MILALKANCAMRWDWDDAPLSQPSVFLFVCSDTWRCDRLTKMVQRASYLCAEKYIWGSGGMSWDAKGVLEAKVSRDTRCPGQSPSWDGVGCPRTPRVVPGHLRCPRTVLSQDGQLSWDGRRRSRTALLGHQVSRDTTCPWTFFSAPERPPLTPDDCGSGIQRETKPGAERGTEPGTPQDIAVQQGVR